MGSTSPVNPQPPLAYPVLAQLAAAPFRLFRPAEPRGPFVFASPHSGRLYPPSFLAASALSPLLLRRSEDAFVAELFDGVVGFGAPLLAAEFPRAYVDANRAATELDPTMFRGPLPLPLEVTSRVKAGLGVIAKVVRDGIDIYRDKLDAREAGARLAHFYQPYHAALAALVEQTRQRFGWAVVIDCHSMPSLPAVAEIVFGDCHGASLEAGLMRRIEAAFAAQGFATARNSPYAGGYTTHRYARRQAGVQALQIEVNRSLYLDEETIQPKPGFAGVKGRLTAALRQVLALAPPQRSQAAE